MKKLFVLALAASLMFGACEGTADLTTTSPAAAPATPAPAPATGGGTTFNAPIVVDSGQIGLDPGEPYIIGLDGQPHPAPNWVRNCANRADYADPTFFAGGSEITWCVEEEPQEGGFVLIDAALLVSLADPVPGDEIAVGVVWVGGKIAQVAVLTGTAIAAAAATNGAISAMSHSNPQHNPSMPGTAANKAVIALMALWASYRASPGGPDPDWIRCAVLKASGAIIKVIIWVKETTLPEGGYLAWYKAAAKTNWGGAYPQSLEKFLNGPERGPTQEYSAINCTDPGMPQGPLKFAH